MERNPESLSTGTGRQHYYISSKTCISICGKKDNAADSPKELLYIYR